MKSILLATIALVGLTAAAHATTYTVNFAGTVSSSTGATGYSVGGTVVGNFTLVGGSDTITSFNIDGQSAPAGSSSMVNIVPAFTDAIYESQLSAVSQGGNTNATFALDLSSLTTFPSTETPDSLLTDTTQLTTNLDLASNPASAFPSTFSYYTATAAGNNILSLTANLTAIQVSATGTPVPEPTSLALLATSLVGLGFAARRRARA